MKENYVLLGGWSRHTETYRNAVQTAPQKRNVYIIPHASLIPDIKIPSLSEINSRILQELEQKNLTNITLIGHSLGGVFAISFTANYPEYVKELVLVDSEGIQDKRNFSIVVYNWLKDNLFVNGFAKAKENIKALIRIVQNFPYYFVTARFAKNIDVRYDAKKIKTPTLILWGEKDKVTTTKNAKEFTRLIKDSKLVILPGMDHDWLIHNPQELWKNINKG